MIDNEAITLRRRIDDQFSETLLDYQARQLEVSERLARIDESLCHLRVEFDAGRQGRMTIQEQQTTITERLSALSARFVAHINDESAERALLQEMTRTVAAHSERMTALERVQIALWSVVGTLATGGVVWIVGHLTLTAGR
jgi:hypothetical protein